MVFALGIGTTIEHAEMLITAFQRLCAQADQQYKQQSGAADVLLHTTSLQRAGVRKPVQPVNEVNSLQCMSLREAFFAKTVRWVSLCHMLWVFWRILRVIQCPHNWTAEEYAPLHAAAAVAAVLSERLFHHFASGG